MKPKPKPKHFNQAHYDYRDIDIQSRSEDDVPYARYILMLKYFRLFVYAFVSQLLDTTDIIMGDKWEILMKGMKCKQSLNDVDAE